MQLFLKATTVTVGDDTLSVGEFGKKFFNDATVEVFVNDTFQVTKSRLLPKAGKLNMPEMWMLIVRRKAAGGEISWRDLQDIKNMLIGAKNEAVELYPSESRVLKDAGEEQRFLWGFTNPTINFPFGFTTSKILKPGLIQN